MRAIRLALGLCLGAVTATMAGAGEDAVPEERIIEHQLDTTQSRVLRNSARPLGSPDEPLGSSNRLRESPDPPLGDRPLERSQVTRDLGAAEQRLRSFKTREPNAPSTPLLERQLDRLSRPTNLRQR
jgi:hypothetical protein